MRIIGWTLLLLVSVGWLSSEIRVAEPPSSQPDRTDWRRTADGWEHRTLWLHAPPAPPPSLHPAVVGVLQVLLSAFALLALPAIGRSRRAPADTVGTIPSPSPRAARQAFPG